MISQPSSSRSSRKTLAVLLPDGVGVRNFVLGPFLGRAGKRHDLAVFHQIPDDLLPEYRGAAPASVEWRRLLRFRDRPASFLLRNSLSVAQMYWVDNFPMREARSRPITGSFKLRLASRAARFIGRHAAAPQRMRWLERLHSAVLRRSAEVKSYVEQFEALSPSVLFCSHQRPPSVIPAVLAAKILGIPTATFIFSWDNLSSKGRIAAPFDHYLVWSEHMQRELHRFYPDVDQNRVHVVGTPQFDPYQDASLHWNREEFCRRIGADPHRRLICFSGGDVGNSKEDHLHVRALLELIAAGKIRNRPQVILRPAPVDNGDRYASVRRDYPELIFAQPAWHNVRAQDTSDVMPDPSDVQFLVNLTQHADLNINFASTMTLDFAIHDRPVINVVIDMCQPLSYEVSQWDFVRQFEHYHPVINFQAARFAHTVEQLADHVNAYLADPTLDREGRRHFCELEVGVPVGASSDRIVDVLEAIAEDRAIPLRPLQATPEPTLIGGSCGDQGVATR